MPRCHVRIHVFVMFIIVAFERRLGVSSLLSGSQNKDSLCQQYHKIIATRLVSYRETFIYHGWQREQRTRINFRTENVTKWTVVETCCNGYEPHQLSEDAEECVPICPGGCINGECVYSNTCHCNRGYTAITDSLCLPECESGCKGGTCIEPNVCNCFYGYISMNNDTSCEPSCQSIGSDGSQGCVDNASCVSPDTCQCDDGYAPVWDVQHDDMTDEKKTSEAFTAMTRELVSAMTVPSISTLIPTQHTNPVKCNPVCDSDCGKNAVCIRPNICQCHPGYQTSLLSDESADGALCLPICEKKCFNGYCGSPNECVCHEGYKPHSWLNTSLCEPFCEDYCVNGKCTLPNHCECLDGYEKLIPRNGSYDRISDNVCIPICPGGCANGCCIAPGQCYCNPGYALLSVKQDAFMNTLSTPSGERSMNLFPQSCEPFCQPACANGSVCIAPNKCQRQLLYGQDVSRLPKNRTRIVNSTKDCGTEGLFFEDNGDCLCNYDLKGQKCSEPSICAVLMVNATKTHEKFTKLESIVFLNGTVKIVNDTDDGYKQGLNECKNECRILISTREIEESINRSATNCHQLELYNSTVGLLSTKHKDLTQFYLEQNSSVLCFVSPGFGCNAKKLRVVSVKSGAVIGGVIGAILIVVLIVGLGLAIYLTLRKKCSMSLLRGGAFRNDVTIMEQSEGTDIPLNTDESSHL